MSENAGQRLFDKVLTGLTLGGYDELTTAKKVYQDRYNEYRVAFNRNEELHRSAHRRIDSFGRDMITTFGILKRAQTIFVRCGRLERAAAQLPDAESTNMSVRLRASVDGIHRQAEIDRLVKDFSAGALAVGGAGVGAGAGSALAAGSWSLVAIAGSASTGTAISSLSGIALHNAILAWFGGGALAAGGLGMAGGTAVLGGIVVVPMIAFAAWKSRAEAKKILDETAKVKAAQDEIEINLSELEATVERLHVAIDRVTPLAKKLKDDYEIAIKVLYPFYGWSIFKRWLKKLFVEEFLDEYESFLVYNLQQSALGFADSFRDRGSLA